MKAAICESGDSYHSREPPGEPFFALPAASGIVIPELMVIRRFPDPNLYRFGAARRAGAWPYFSINGNKMAERLYGDFRMKHILLLLLLYAQIAGVSIQLPQAAPTHCAAELRAAMHRMHDAAAKVTATKDTDRDFVRLMLPHH